MVPILQQNDFYDILLDIMPFHAADTSKFFSCREIGQLVFHGFPPMKWSFCDSGSDITQSVQIFSLSTINFWIERKVPHNGMRNKTRDIVPLSETNPWILGPREEIPTIGMIIMNDTITSSRKVQRNYTS